MSKSSAPKALTVTNPACLIDGSDAEFRHLINGLLPFAARLLSVRDGFGSLIGLIACHFGLRIKPNTEDLGRGTTSSVVTAITVVILADAVFAIVFKGVGF